MESAKTEPSKSNLSRIHIGIPIAGAVLAVGIIMLTQLAVGDFSSSPKTESIASPEAVAKRLALVGEVKVDPNAPSLVASVPLAGAQAEKQIASAPAAGSSAASAANAGVVAAGSAPPPATAKTVAVSTAGKTTYEAVCIACHSAGIAGAPKTGDKAAWTPRLAQGADVLYQSALKGKGVMPAKGGNAALPDEDIKAAVDYILAQSK